MWPIMNLPVRLSYKSCPILINVFFVIDTGSPITTLTTQVLDKLDENCPKIEKTSKNYINVFIAGHYI